MIEFDHDTIAACCTATPPDSDGSALVNAIAHCCAAPELKLALVRGGWHRLGGVVDGDYRPIAEHLLQWAEEESQGDLEDLVLRYIDAGYFATRIRGKTHYLTLSTGPEPYDFIQIEVEELQEEVERILIDRDWYPEDLEEFVAPMANFPRIDPEPIAPPRYHLRRIFTAHQLLATQRLQHPPQYQNMTRFGSEWSHSSASHHPLCHHWVIAVRESIDAEGDARYALRPIPTHDAPPYTRKPLPETLFGAELANLLTTIDREAGHPFAWYFLMLGSAMVTHQLGDRVLLDHLNDYSYLPQRDLQVLTSWHQKPYSV